MRGLYYKDMCCLKKLLHTMIPVCAATLIFALLVVFSIRYGNMGRMLSGEIEEAINEESAPVILFYVIGISLLIPMGFFVDTLRCFEMDELADFDKIVRTLPVKPRDVVTARYLTYMTFAGVGTGCSVLSAALVSGSAGAMGIEELSMKNLLFLILVLAAVLLLFCGIQIPFFYAWGRKKGTVVSIFLIAIPLAVFYGKFIMLLDQKSDRELLPYLMEKMQDWKQVMIQSGPMIAAGIVVLYGISYGVSIWLYKRGGRK